MHIIRGTVNLAAARRPAVVTIGNFDGIHRGHAAIIDTVLRESRRTGGVPTVVTFEPLPESFFARQRQGEEPARLTPMRERGRLLAELGIEQLVLLRFSRALAGMEASVFVKTVLEDGLQACSVVVGDDFRFGKARGGDFDLLARWGASRGVTVQATPSITMEGERISSSAIRRALAEGDIGLAEAWLGRPWSQMGKVVHGDHLGRQLGYPTANLALHGAPPPVRGVWAVEGGPEGHAPSWQGIANIGQRPTLAGREWRFEVHWFDRDVDLYGQRLRVYPRAFVRPERGFADVQALKQQIDYDCQQARRFFANRPTATGTERNHV
jgi:riboflavin kinase/FMN adenylyltransferase